MKNNTALLNRFRVFAAMLCMVLSLGITLCPADVYANGSTEESGTSSDYDISWLGGEGNGAFAKLEKQVQDTGNSAYRLFLAIGVVGLVLSIVLCGLSIAVSGGGNKRSEKLSWLLWIGIGGIVIFGAMSIVSVLQNIGGNIV